MNTILISALWFSSAALGFAVEVARSDAFADQAAMLSQLQHRDGEASVQPFTLAQLEESALRTNPEIRVAARRVLVAESEIGEAGALEDASLMYRGWGVPLRRPWDFNRAQNMFMLAQPVPGPGKRALQKEIAKQQVQTARALLEAQRRQVVAEVRKGYYELLRNQDELRLHDEQVVLAQQALESARIKYTVGKVPQQDVLKAQIALTRLVDHLIMFRTDRRLAQARLNSLIGRRPDLPMRVTGPYQLPVRLPGFRELGAVAVSSRPELLASQSSVERQALATKLARKAYTPDFTFAGGYMLMPSGSPDRHGYMAEVSLTLPWLNRSRHDSEIAQAEASQSLQLAEYEALRSAVLQQIQEALVYCEAASDLVKLYRETLRPQAQATFKAASAAYQTDRTDFLNLLDAQTTLLEVEYGYYKALAEFDQRWAELELAVGAPVERARQQEMEVLP